MAHLNDGKLRRIYDEPLALSATDQAHYDHCAECKSRFDAIANDARATASLLTVPGFEPQPAVALATVRSRIHSNEAARPPRWYERWWAGWLESFNARWRPISRPVLAVVVAAAVLAAFTASGVLQSMIKVFEPTTVAPVAVSPSDLLNVGSVLDYGTIKWLPAPPTAQPLTDAASAASLAGLPALVPRSLPAGVSGPVTYGVISKATGSLTFDSARLRASAQQQHVKVGPMPASIDGSTLYVTGGPALLELWGTTSASGASTLAPVLVIAQTRVPTVYSTGATAAQLEDYVLSQPGVPPDIAAQVRAIKDPTSTLPIPIPQGLATTSTVKINGVNGLMVSAGFAAGVVWVKDGVIYAVGGQLTPDQVLAIATNLH
jgi:hypothetical protein